MLGPRARRGVGVQRALDRTRGRGARFPSQAPGPSGGHGRQGFAAPGRETGRRRPRETASRQPNFSGKQTFYKLSVGRSPWSLCTTSKVQVLHKQYGKNLGQHKVHWTCHGGGTVYQKRRPSYGSSKANVEERQGLYWALGPWVKLDVGGGGTRLGVAKSSSGRNGLTPGSCRQGGKGKRGESGSWPVRELASPMGVRRGGQ